MATAPVLDMPEPFILTITIPGAPVGKGRPRFTATGGFARVYTPARTRRYEDLIRIEAARAMGGAQPLTEAVSMVVTAYVAPPRSLSRKRRQDALDGLLKPVTRPDADNYLKAALDGCNAIVFRDDSQVTDIIVRKRYSERPRLVITITAGEDFA